MKSSTFLFILSSLLLTIFLFYIDEGNYHLEGILMPANLVPLGIYFIGIFVSKRLLFRLIKPGISAGRALVIAVTLGSFTGTLLTAGFFVGLSALRTIG